MRHSFTSLELVVYRTVYIYVYLSMAIDIKTFGLDEKNSFLPHTETVGSVAV